MQDGGEVEAVGEGGDGADDHACGVPPCCKLGRGGRWGRWQGGAKDKEE